MLITIFIFLAATVGAGLINTRARILVTFAAIVAGIVLIVSSDSDPTQSLGAAVLMAAGSVSLAGMYFGTKVRISFGLVTALPFAFVAVAAWPLTQDPGTADSAMDLVLLASAGVVAFIALSLGRPTPEPKRSRNSSVGPDGSGPGQPPD